MVTLGVKEYNQYARVYRFNRVKKARRTHWTKSGYATCENERCNNCKATFWQFWQNDEFPHYCPKCRFELRAMFNGRYWDDEEEIPF